MGSGEHHTVVVGLGNFDQTPSRWLVGVEASGPVLFEILEVLGDGWSQATPPALSELSPITVWRAVRAPAVECLPLENAGSGTLATDPNRALCRASLGGGGRRYG